MIIRRESTHRLARAWLIAITLAVALPGAVSADPEPSTPITDSGPPSDEAILSIEERAAAAGAVGAFIDRKTGEYVVVGPRGMDAKVLEDAHLDGAGIRVRIETRSVDERTIDAIYDRLIAFRDERASAGITYKFGFDDAIGKVVISGSAPREAFESILRVFPETTYTAGGSYVRTSRGNDGEPHWGGAEIHTIFSGNCSSGYTVLKTSNGLRYMVTAGHCADPGVLVTQPDTGASYGTGRYQAPYPANDASLIGDEQFGPRIYTGGATGTGSIVKGAGNPGLGVNYCFSGSVTFETCSHNVFDTDEQVCFPAGCTQHLAILRGGTAIKAGDSGGPVFLWSSPNVYIRGHIVGCKTSAPNTCQSNPSETYVQKWGSTMTLFGVSIVTG